MRPMFHFMRQLRRLPESAERLYSLQDLRGLLPERGWEATKAIIFRLEQSGELERVCRGLYKLPECSLSGTDLLARAAARLRAGQLNYLSLETVLSEAGVISQIPMGRLMLMSSGRSYVMSCAPHGEIEFIHTAKTAGQVADELTYDGRYQLWRASVPLALRDMKDTRRDTGLVNLEEAHEFV